MNDDSQIQPALAKLLGLVVTVVATYFGGEHIGESRMTEERNARVPTETVIHLSSVIADLEDQLREAESRQCPAEEITR